MSALYQEEQACQLDGHVLKLKEPNTVQWLSLHGAVETFLRVLPAVIATLENDASDTSLYFVSPRERP